MTCYRVNWTLNEQQLAPIMAWLDENREALGLIRDTASGGLDQESGDVIWYTKFVFRTEHGIRLFYCRWEPSYSEEWEFKPWS